MITNALLNHSVTREQELFLKSQLNLNDYFAILFKWAETTSVTAARELELSWRIN